MTECYIWTPLHAAMLVNCRTRPHAVGNVHSASAWVRTKAGVGTCLRQHEGIGRNLVDEPPPLLAVGEVNASLKDAAAVAVRRHLHAVVARRVIDELRVLGTQPLQPRCQLRAASLIRVRVGSCSTTDNESMVHLSSVGTAKQR